MSNPTPKEIIESLRSEITALRQEWTEDRINTAALQAHAERVGQANDLLVVENAALRSAAVELAAIGRVWITVWRDQLSGDSVRRFGELEQQILKEVKP